MSRLVYIDKNGQCKVRKEGGMPGRQARPRLGEGSQGCQLPQGGCPVPVRGRHDNGRSRPQDRVHDKVQAAVRHARGDAKGADSPCYTTIFRRIQKLDVDIAENIITVRDKSRNLVMIADAAGLKQHNRGEWICKKWKTRRGFVKMHLMVDADTKQVLAVSVTSDAVGDSTELPALLEEATKDIKEEEEQQQELTDGADAVKIPNMLADGISPMTLLDTGTNPDTPGKILLADGAYGSRKNVAECHKRGIKPLIRLLTSCNARGKGTGDKWGMLVRWQLGGGPEMPVGDLSKEERQENLRYSKSTVGFGSRWIVEIVISSIKRMFGEGVMALKWSNVVQEVKLRIWLYNK